MGLGQGGHGGALACRVKNPWKKETECGARSWSARASPLFGQGFESKDKQRNRYTTHWRPSCGGLTSTKEWAFDGWPPIGKNTREWPIALLPWWPESMVWAVRQTLPSKYQVSEATARYPEAWLGWRVEQSAIFMFARPWFPIPNFSGRQIFNSVRTSLRKMPFSEPKGCCVSVHDDAPFPLFYDPRASKTILEGF